MGMFARSPDLRGANCLQRAKILLAERFGRGPLFTRAAVWSDLGDPQNGARGIFSAASLAALEEEIHRAPTRQAAYNLLARPLPGYEAVDPKAQPVWFDAVTTLTEPPIIRAIAQAAYKLRPRPELWANACDVGAGTGNLSAELLGNAAGQRSVGSVTLVDRASELLGVAARRYGPAMNYCVGDATKVPFKSEALDLIVSSGLVYSLGKERVASYFSEVGRLLRPGGIYLDGDYPDANRLPRIENFGRFALNWTIKQHLTDERRGNPLAGVDPGVYFSQFDLSHSEHRYEDAATGAQVAVRVLQKVAY